MHVFLCPLTCHKGKVENKCEIRSEILFSNFSNNKTGHLESFPISSFFIFLLHYCFYPWLFVWPVPGFDKFFNRADRTWDSYFMSCHGRTFCLFVCKAWGTWHVKEEEEVSSHSIDIKTMSHASDSWIQLAVRNLAENVSDSKIHCYDKMRLFPTKLLDSNVHFLCVLQYFRHRRCFSWP